MVGEWFQYFQYPEEGLLLDEGEYPAIGPGGVVVEGEEDLVDVVGTDPNLPRLGDLDDEGVDLQEFFLGEFPTNIEGDDLQQSLEAVNVAVQ